MDAPAEGMFSDYRRRLAEYPENASEVDPDLLIVANDQPDLARRLPMLAVPLPDAEPEALVVSLDVQGVAGRALDVLLERLIAVLEDRLALAPHNPLPIPVAAALALAVAVPGRPRGLAVAVPGRPRGLAVAVPGRPRGRKRPTPLKID